MDSQILPGPTLNMSTGEESPGAWMDTWRPCEFCGGTGALIGRDEPYLQGDMEGWGGLAQDWTHDPKAVTPQLPRPPRQGAWPQSLYHVSPAVNHRAIAEQGLMGHDPSVPMYNPTGWGKGIRGNYAFDHLDNALSYARVHAHRGPMDIWQINPQGLNVEQDPEPWYLNREKLAPEDLNPWDFMKGDDYGTDEFPADYRYWERPAPEGEDPDEWRNNEESFQLTNGRPITWRINQHVPPNQVSHVHTIHPELVKDYPEDEMGIPIDPGRKLWAPEPVSQVDFGNDPKGFQDFYDRFSSWRFAKIARARYPHFHWLSGKPCNCTFGPEADMSRTASKMDWLREREDLQDPVSQRWLNWLENHQVDALYPWLTREWKKGRIYFPQRQPVDQGDLGGEWTDFERSRDPQWRWGPANAHYDIGEANPDQYGKTLFPGVLDHWHDWYNSDHPTRRGVDIGSKKFTVADMHNKIGEWDEDMKRRAEEAQLQQQNDAPVLHQYPDGWTLRHLQPQHLDYEGQVMGHCVGGFGYEKAVAKGQRDILSLRDPQGRPHVTAELRRQRDPNFDLDDAAKQNDVLRSLQNMGRLPSGDSGEDYMNQLRAFHQNGGTVHPEGPMNHKDLTKLYDGIKREYAGKSPIDSFDNAKITQIQGKGNEVPKPEYQQRMKDWFQTFPENTRPDFEYEPYTHPSQLDPNPDWRDDYHPFGDELDPDYGHADMGGYGPHGDYGLVGRRPTDYRLMLQNIGAPAYEYSSQDTENLFDHARMREELPQLQQALNEYRNRQMKSNPYNLHDQMIPGQMVNHLNGLFNSNVQTDQPAQIPPQQSSFKQGGWHFGWGLDDLPQEQTDIWRGSDDDYLRRMQQFERDPTAGAAIWRGEDRNWTGETPDSVGMHWTINPDAVLKQAYPQNQTVIWEGRLHDPQTQMIPRDHPIFQGRSRPLNWEGEVRLRPGAPVQLKGAYVWKGGDASNRWWPELKPDKTNYADWWDYHPIDDWSQVAPNPDPHGISYNYPDLAYQGPGIPGRVSAQGGMRLEFLPVNNAWVVTFGGNPISVDRIPGMGTKRFFQSREEAVEGLKRVGLEALPDGTVQSQSQQSPEHPDPWMDSEPGTLTMPDHWSKLGSMNLPEPGQTPIPEGTIRLWHYTHPDNLDAIREQGLLYSKGRGDSGTGVDEPSKGVWASTQQPSYDHLAAKPYVEYWAHPEQISRNAEHYWDRDPLEWANNGRPHHVIMQGDVPPEQIAAIHEPWHQHYRYMMENYPTPESVEQHGMEPDSFDWTFDPQRGGGDQLGKGVQAWKQQVFGDS